MFVSFQKSFSLLYPYDFKYSLKSLTHKFNTAGRAITDINMVAPGLATRTNSLIAFFRLASVRKCDSGPPMHKTISKELSLYGKSVIEPKSTESTNLPTRFCFIFRLATSNSLSEMSNKVI